MIMVSYSTRERVLFLSEWEDGREVRVLCIFYDVGVGRVSEHSLELSNEGGYVGRVSFDGVLYGIPVRGKGGY